ncbi:hypothetical protein R83H12_02901 [Fibrobacteria bacterium R8-3-H12]
MFVELHNLFAAGSYDRIICSTEGIMVVGDSKSIAPISHEPVYKGLAWNPGFGYIQNAP